MLGFSSGKTKEAGRKTRAMSTIYNLLTVCISLTIRSMDEEVRGGRDLLSNALKVEGWQRCEPHFNVNTVYYTRVCFP